MQKKGGILSECDIIPTASTFRQIYPKNSKWRVKVFSLDTNDSWADQGTGDAQIIKEVFLCFYNEFYRVDKYYFK